MIRRSFIRLLPALCAIPVVVEKMGEPSPMDLLEDGPFYGTEDLDDVVDTYYIWVGEDLKCWPTLDRVPPEGMKTVGYVEVATA